VLLVTHELDEAEQLCDRVLAMRAGRVLDSGTPAELVDRHGPSARISFTAPADPSLAAPLAALPGVRRVEERSGKVTVTGDRSAIAHVGAALVQGGWVPPDLSVRVPSLEDALVGLLERAEWNAAHEVADLEPIGATR
jgi:ABC-2 type transport system ATP-binding protein